MNYNISVELINQTLAYLAAQPYQNVYKLIQQLQALQPSSQPAPSLAVADDSKSA